MATTWLWGTVTQVSPSLAVQLDGDAAALPYAPDSLIDPHSLAINMRVRCEMTGAAVIIHGAYVPTTAGAAIQVPPPTGIVSTDTANIQNAINLAQTLGIGLVQLQAGSYWVSSLTTTAAAYLPTLAGLGQQFTTLNIRYTGVGLTFLGVSGIGSQKFTGRLVRDLTVNASSRTSTLAVTPVGSGGTFAAGTYYWYTTYTDSTGESVPSNEVTATLVANGSASFTWASPGAGVTAVKVYRGTKSGGESVLVTTLAGTATSYTDTGSAGTAGSAVTCGIEIQAVAHGSIERVNFSGPFTTGLRLHNYASGTYTESCLAIDCNFSLNMVALEYKVTSGNASFNRSGMVRCSISGSPNGPSILIGAGARPYNAPLEIALWGLTTTFPYIQSNTSQTPTFYGVIAIDGMGVSGLTLVAATGPNVQLYGKVMSYNAASLSNGALTLF